MSGKNTQQGNGEKNKISTSIRISKTDKKYLDRKKESNSKYVRKLIRQDMRDSKTAKAKKQELDKKYEELKQIKKDIEKIEKEITEKLEKTEEEKTEIKQNIEQKIHDTQEELEQEKYNRIREKLFENNKTVIMLHKKEYDNYNIDKTTYEEIAKKVALEKETEINKKINNREREKIIEEQLSKKSRKHLGQSRTEFEIGEVDEEYKKAIIKKYKEKEDK